MAVSVWPQVANKNGERVSYRELNRRANRLARHLHALCGDQARVGIFLDRSVEMVVGLIAALKAGAAYVPLDPAYPEERLRLMIEDSQVTAVLTQGRLRSRLPRHRRVPAHFLFFQPDRVGGFIRFL